MTYKITIEERATIKPHSKDRCGELYVTTKPMEIRIDSKHFKVSPRFVKIKKGFITDLASIPWVFQWAYKPNHSQSMYPAILHDWMYHNGCHFTRKEADLIFYYFLRQEGFNWVRANLYYLAVRAGGSKFYKNVNCAV